MQINLNLLVAAILCLMPLAIALTAISSKRKEQREFRHPPFKELQRRPAGETIRLELEELDDKITEQIFGLVLFPMLMVLLLFSLHPEYLLTPILSVVVSTGSSVFFGVSLHKLLQKRSNYILGFEGERFVAEELSRLIALGFEIYHDVPFDEFNIDHVLAGPRGVYVVETKTRRKPVKGGIKEFRVQFDGKSLQWPWGEDSHGIEQAKNNAKTLSAWLTSSTGENVQATPILTLPGWMVERKTPGDSLYVVNPKEIYGVCSSQPEKFGEPLIRRICHQLDQKCRIEVR